MKSRVFFAFILSALFFSLKLEATLPPLYEGSRRYKAVLESEELYKILDASDWITSIEFKKDNLFYVTTRKKMIVFRVFPCKDRDESKVIGRPHALCVEVIESGEHK
jgi:hypothetical protein